MTLTIGSLFSGFGGLELGLEREGYGPVLWQVEKDPYCRAVLAKHWPGVPRFNDVREVGAELPNVDLLCGGFPCQDVSGAGLGAGLAGERSGLWYEFRRIVEALSPAVVLVENVASGTRRWLPHVRRDLHLLGYRTRAFSLSAAELGAPHLRRRVFVIAYSDRLGLRLKPRRGSGTRRSRAPKPADDGVTRNVATVGDPVRDGRSRAEGQSYERRAEPATGGWWASEPAVGRVVDGVSGGLGGRKRRAQLRGLGNAVTPPQAQTIARVMRASLPSSKEKA